MDIYQYVAENNPYAAKAICNKFGYRTTNIQSKTDLGDALREVVMREGEPALKEVADNHPDKELILELFQPVETFKGADGSAMVEKKSGCNGCNSVKEHYLNADGASKSAMQTNTFLMAAALILAVAIISKN